MPPSPFLPSAGLGLLTNNSSRSERAAAARLKVNFAWGRWWQSHDETCEFCLPFNDATAARRLGFVKFRSEAEKGCCVLGNAFNLLPITLR